MSPRRPPIIIDNDIEASGFGSGSDPIGVGVVRHDGCLVFDVASRLNELQRGRLGYGDNWVPGRPRLARLQAAVSMRGDFTFLDANSAVVARLAGYEAVMDPLLNRAFKPSGAPSHARDGG